MDNDNEKRTLPKRVADAVSDFAGVISPVKAVTDSLKADFEEEQQVDEKGMQRLKEFGDPSADLDYSYNTEDIPDYMMPKSVRRYM